MNTLVSCIEIVATATLPPPPPVEGGGFKTLSPGGRGKGERESNLKRPNVILSAGRYNSGY